MWLLAGPPKAGLQGRTPKADVSAIQLVGYQTSSEEIGDLYHQVYMHLRGCPGPPLYGPERA